MTEQLTPYVVHANGTFWGIWDATSPTAAMQAAVDDVGTDDSDAVGLTAETLKQTLRRINATYRDNDMSLTDGVCQWMNCEEAKWDGEAIWIANPMVGHWIDRGQMCGFLAWVEK